MARNRWRQALTASASFWLTMCLFGPLILEMADSPCDLIAIIITLLLVSSIFTLLTSFFLVQLLPYRLFVLATLLLVTLGIVFYVRVFFASSVAIWISGKISIVNLQQYYFLIGALLMSAGLITVWISRRFIVRHINSIATLFVTFQIVFVALWYTTGPIPDFGFAYQLTNVYGHSFSKSRNILLLVFDTITTNDFKEVLNYEKGLADCLQGFTFYPDSVGGYSETRAAVPHIMTGLFHDNSVPLNTFLKSNLPTESIPGILQKASFRTEVYGAGAHFVMQTPVWDNKNTKPLVFPNPSEVARAIFKFWFRCTPVFTRKYILSSYLNASYMGLYNALYGAAWIGGAAYDLSRIEKLEKRASADTNDHVFKYEHFWGVHTSYFLSESMQIRNWSNGLDAQKDQSKATIKLCCRYLEVLKKIGVYDHSMIFVIGDHAEWGASRPSPLMLWKPFNDSQPFRESSMPVDQSDIISTICDELGIPLDRRHGASLRHENITSRIRRYLHHPRLENEPTDYFSKLREFIVTGPIDSFFSMIPTFATFPPGGKEILPRLHIGSTLEFKTNGNYSEYIGISGWGEPEANIVWNNDTQAGLYLPIQNTGVPLQISIRCRPFRSTPSITGQRLKVIDRNDKVLFDSQLTEPTTATFQVPADAFIGDVLALQFQFPDSVHPADLDSPLGMERSIGFESLTIE